MKTSAERSYLLTLECQVGMLASMEKYLREHRPPASLSLETINDAMHQAVLAGLVAARLALREGTERAYQAALKGRCTVIVSVGNGNDHCRKLAVESRQGTRWCEQHKRAVEHAEGKETK